MEQFEEENYCLLDGSFSSNLLASKIADISEKNKFETIIKPLFDHCLGNSDNVSEINRQEQDIIQFILHKYNNPNKFNEDQLFNITIDWIRDRNFLFHQILKASLFKIDMIAERYGLWKNRTFLLNYINLTKYENKTVLEYVGEEFQNDREIVMAALKVNPMNLEFASTEMKSDREVVMLAVEQEGTTLRYASDELKQDFELVKMAISNHTSALKFASKDLQNNEELVSLVNKKDFELYE